MYGVVIKERLGVFLFLSVISFLLACFSSGFLILIRFINDFNFGLSSAFTVFLLIFFLFSFFLAIKDFRTIISYSCRNEVSRSYVAEAIFKYRINLKDYRDDPSGLIEKIRKEKTIKKERIK